jgi:putative GTP pyrophosphokinase
MNIINEEAELSELEFREEYDRLSVLASCGLRHIAAYAENLRQQQELVARSNQRPAFIIHAIYSRVKRIASVRAKLQRKSLPLTVKNLRDLHDIAGIRIVTVFPDDIYRVRDALAKQLTIVAEKDYIKNPKSNGYRSLHLIVDTHVSFQDTAKSVLVEIQIRDLVMDMWSELHHVLVYKRPKHHYDESDDDSVTEVDEVAATYESTDESFRKLNEVLITVDESAQKLYDTT